jgi:hypothetical protein
MEQGPLSQRDEWKLFFPNWIVDHVVAPFPDEIGWLLFCLKWLVVGAFLAVLLKGWLSIPVGLVAMGLCGLVFTALFPEDE